MRWSTIKCEVLWIIFVISEWLCASLSGIELECHLLFTLGLVILLQMDCLKFSQRYPQNILIKIYGLVVCLDLESTNSKILNDED